MLAIVIPYFKKKYFFECLASLASQTDKNFNVYIGDDASPEDPSDIIYKFQDSLNIIYYKFDENFGSKSLTKQWDRCINLIKDEKWIMILGDDDYIGANCIEEFYKNVEKIDKLNIKVVRYATRVIRMETGKISSLYTHPEIEKATDFFFRKFLRGSRGSLSEQIFHRDNYQKYGFRDFPLGWGADNFAWLDFTEFGNIYTINSGTVYFRFSNFNISRGGYESDLKYETKYYYFTLIISKYLRKFRKDQRLELLRFYELIVQNSDKVRINYILKMFSTYLKEGYFIQALKFLRRLIVSKLD